MLKITGVVVLYNPESEVKDNMLTYLKFVDKLYVVDNTPDKNNSYLLPKSKKIEYICNNENFGIAGALNIGANRAIEDGYKWLLTMDQDSKFNDENLTEMIKWLDKNKSDDIGLVSPWHDIGLNIVKPYNEIDTNEVVMTSGNIINLNCYEKIGGYSEWLFIDCVDFDYCLKLISKKYKTIRLNSVIMEHSLGNISKDKFLFKLITHSNHNYIRRYYITRNSHYMIKMYKREFPNFIKNIKKELRRDVVKVILLEKNKYRKIRNMFRGYLDYKKGVNGKYKY